MYYTEANNL